MKPQPEMLACTSRAARRATARPIRTTTLAARITLRQSRDNAAPARTERARRVRAARRALRDARRASRQA